MTRASIYRNLRRFVSVPTLVRWKRRYMRTANLVKYGEYYFPELISIELSAHCNRRCHYCPVSISPMPKEIIKHSVFRQAVERLMDINWTGSVAVSFYNEPLLLKDINTYLRQIRQLLPKCMIEIFTNGDALTVETAGTLIADGVDTFIVTQHPPSSEAWAKRMLEVKARFPDYIKLTNIEDIELSNRGGLVEVKKTADLYKDGCSTAINCLIIDIHGDYLFCCCDYNRENKMGNIADMGVLEAWRIPEWRNARLSAMRRKPIIDICKACFK